MTPDKDLGPVPRGDRVVQVDRRQQKVTDEAAFRAAARLRRRASMPDYLALTGDTADGIPGLPGFGEKSAALLHRRLPAPGGTSPTTRRPGACKPRGAPQLAATLAAQREEALLYRKLATLVDTVPLRRDRWTTSASAACRASRSRPGATASAARTVRTMPRRWLSLLGRNCHDLTGFRGLS